MMSAAVINEAAAKLAADRILAELSMIESVYCDHLRGVPVAKASGIALEYFSEGDARLLWCACNVCFDVSASHQQLLRLSALALQADRYWNPAGPIGPPFPPLWSHENLARLAQREYHSAPVIRRNARRLIDLHRRQDSARQHLADAWSAMTEADAPAPIGRQTICMLPVKVRAA